MWGVVFRHIGNFSAVGCMAELSAAWSLYIVYTALRAHGGSITFVSLADRLIHVGVDGPSITLSGGSYITLVSGYCQMMEEIVIDAAAVAGRVPKSVGTKGDFGHSQSSQQLADDGCV